MVKSYPSSLIALPVRDLLWSDWGTASRIRDVLKKTARLKQPKGYRCRDSRIIHILARALAGHGCTPPLTTKSSVTRIDAIVNHVFIFSSF
jgi:hypothetical protein